MKMIVKLILKDPDGISESVERSVYEHIKNSDDLAEGETFDDIVRATKESIRKWVEYDEYIVIVVDTEQQTAKVLEIDE